jgi:hypothetical protein
VTSKELDALVARSAIVGGYDSRRTLSREDFDALVEAARISAKLSPDLDGIRARHLDPERMQGQTFYEGHIVIDLASLVEEVERLRKEV